MPRYYADISKEDFLAKVKEMMNPENYPDDSKLCMKDLDKVQFDWENSTGFDEEEGIGDYPVGWVSCVFCSGRW